MKRLIVSMLVFLISLSICAMDVVEKYRHNTYQGTPITPETLLALAPKMPERLVHKTDRLMHEHGNFIANLVTVPEELGEIFAKGAHNKRLIAQLEQKSAVKNWSGFNYVLRFSGYEDFTVPINVWGSRVVYQCYATGQGDWFDPAWNRCYDPSNFKNEPVYQHCSRVAHYLRLIEIMHKKDFKYLHSTPTYFKHIPGKPEQLDDQNYVVIQEWVQGLKEIKQHAERDQYDIFENISPDALKEMYEALVYAALWDLAANLALDKEGHYYMVDLEEPYNHKPQFFYFQGPQGEEKYVRDVIDGVERMAKRLMHHPKHFESWKRLIEDDRDLQALLVKFNVNLCFAPEHLNKK